MTRLSERSFSCAPCRQTVRVYPVAEHKYLHSIAIERDDASPPADEARAADHQISA
jgi:hypothetical protein